MKSTILLLASDPVVRSVMKETLEHEGYTVLATGDLGNAVDRLKEVQPDLLITRTYVEGLPGHDAAKYLRSKSPKMKVLIVGGLMAGLIMNIFLLPTLYVWSAKDGDKLPEPEAHFEA